MHEALNTRLAALPDDTVVYVSDPGTVWVVHQHTNGG